MHWLACFLFSLSILHGEIYSLKSYGKEILPEIKFKGYITFYGTNVTGKADVDGAMTAHDASFGTLDGNGQISLSNTLVKSDAQITGQLDSEKTVFKGRLTLFTRRSLLSSTVADTIIVRQLPDYTGTQIIEVADGSTINKISFDSRRGEVWVTNSTVNTVDGGKLIKK
jgi:hypothetical protein